VSMLDDAALLRTRSGRSPGEARERWSNSPRSRPTVKCSDDVSQRRGVRHYIPQEADLEPRRGLDLRRAASVTAGVLSLGLAPAACGGPSTPGVATGSTTTTTASPSAFDSTRAMALLTYSSCMHSHGVPNFPDPTSSGGISKEGVISAEGTASNSQVQAASNDWRNLHPAGGSLGGQPVQIVTAQQQQDYFEAAARPRSMASPTSPSPTSPTARWSSQLQHVVDLRSTQFTAHQGPPHLPEAHLGWTPDSGSEG